jgi:hypothetical protein
VTQGSQSLTLGLVLAAAPQPVEGPDLSFHLSRTFSECTKRSPPLLKTDHDPQIYLLYSSFIIEYNDTYQDVRHAGR